MALSTGDSLGVKVLEALGIPTHGVSHIATDLRPGQFATVQITVHVDEDAEDEIVEALRFYELTERKD